MLRIDQQYDDLVKYMKENQSRLKTEHDRFFIPSETDANGVMFARYNPTKRTDHHQNFLDELSGIKPEVYFGEFIKIQEFIRLVESYFQKLEDDITQVVNRRRKDVNIRPKDIPKLKSDYVFLATTDFLKSDKASPVITRALSVVQTNWFIKKNKKNLPELANSLANSLIIDDLTRHTMLLQQEKTSALYRFVSFFRETDYSKRKKIEAINKFVMLLSGARSDSLTLEEIKILNDGRTGKIIKYRQAHFPQIAAIPLPLNKKTPASSPQQSPKKQG